MTLPRLYEGKLLLDFCSGARYEVVDIPGCARRRQILLHCPNILSALAFNNLYGHAHTSWLGLAHAAFGASDKVAVANEILQALGVDWGDVAVIGDDWPDLPLFANAGFACAPANAHAEAMGAAHHVTQREGGRIDVVVTPIMTA